MPESFHPDSFPFPPRYRALRRLGRGGQGEVWLVEDLEVGGLPLALKAVRGAVQADEIERLAGEFLTLGRLAHPGLARVRDFGALPGSGGVYFTADLVAGPTLLAWSASRAGGEGFGDWCSLAARALSVLAYLEGRELLHGDVKPDNLLLESTVTDGVRPRLVDFGAARLRRADPDRPRVGTRVYLPAGRGLDDERSWDLCGLGMSLFHAITGRLPFSSSPDSQLAWWRERAPALPSRIRPGVPAPLDTLIGRLIGRDPDERYETAAEALSDLTRRVSVPRAFLPVGWRLPSFVGRDASLGETARLLASPGAGVVVVAGPPGSGRTRWLETLRGRLQVRGVTTRLLGDRSDVRALADLMAPDGGEGGEGPAAGDAAASLLSRVGGPLTLLVDDGGDGGVVHPLLRELVRRAAEDPRPDRPLSCVLASISLGEATEAFGSPVRRARHVDLERFGPAEIESVVRDFFAVDRVPESVTRHLRERRADGPGSTLAALEDLRSGGAMVDFLGELRVPARALRVRSAAPARVASVAGVDLSAEMARDLGRVHAAGRPLTAAEYAALFPARSLPHWRVRLEELLSRGWLRRVDGPGEVRFVAGPEVAEVIEDAGAEHLTSAVTCLRDAFLDPERSRELGSPDAQSIHVSLLASGGRHRDAARLALRTARDWMRRGRFQEALEVLAASVASARRCTHASQLIVRLRVADLMLRTGHPGDVPTRLPPPRATQPLWFQLAARDRRARAFEASGQPRRAVADLRAITRRIERRVGPGRGLLLEAEARLARLLLRAGETDAGWRLVERASGRLERCPDSRVAEREIRAAGILASCHITHGEAVSASRLLQRVVGPGRRAGRLDLLAGPLNELAVLQAGRREMDAALATFAELERLAIEARDPSAEIRAVYNRANVLYRMGRLDEAEVLHRRACARAESLGRSSRSATLWIGLAVVLRERGRFREALRLYLRALRIAEGSGDSAEVIARNNLGEIYLTLGYLERSRRERSLAVRLARRIGDRFLIGLSLRSLGAVSWALGRDRAAERRIREALDLETDSGDPRHVGSCRFLLGALAAGRGEGREAAREWARARRRCRLDGDPRFETASDLALRALRVETGRVPRRAGGHQRPEPIDGRGHWRAIDGLLTELERGSAEVDRARVEALLRAGEEDGRRWETFLGATVLEWIGRLPPDLARRVRGLREALAARMTRRLSASARAAFRTWWRLPSSDGSRRAPGPAAAVGPATGEEVPVPALLARLRGEGAVELGPWLVDALDRLGRATGSGGAWCLRLDAGPERVYSAPGSREPPPLDFGGADLIDAARRGRGPVRAGGGWIAALDPPGQWLLLVVPPAAGWTDADAEARRSRFEDACVAIGLILRLARGEEDLERERQGHQDARSELLKRDVTRRREEETRLLDTEVLESRRGAESTRRRMEQLVAASGWPRVVPVARSPAMRELFERLVAVAEGEFPVLILGESGVGKDLVAHWIHALSARAGQPFLAEICSLPEGLLETELFGHARGAFTDAHRDRPGLFRRAHGGTIYLDEVTELSRDLQARLLRVVERRRVRPVGADDEVEVDFRLVSSSRALSPDDPEASGLRRDLYHRLQGEILRIPPLRERPEDLSELITELVARWSSREGRPLPYVPRETRDRLLAHDWPGNVRELENEIESALLEEPGVLRADRVLRSRGREPQGERAGTADAIAPLRPSRDRWERRTLVDALERSDGNATRAARALQVSRRHLGKLLEKHGIDLESLKASLRRRGSG